MCDQAECISYFSLLSKQNAKTNNGLFFSKLGG
jgi:hypothetical protein